MAKTESAGQPARESDRSRQQYTDCGHAGPDVMMTEDPRGSCNGVPHWLCGECLARVEEARQ